MYAAGKIPGSFFKREGRAGEKGTLTARMIDRPIRPLFPKGWRRETQLVAIPMSVDHVNPYDILAMNGASAALMVSDIPFPMPVGAVRIGKDEDGAFVVNPEEESLLEGDLDLIVAGTEEAILMVEAGANEVTEAEILDALDIAHGEIKKLCEAQRELQKKAGKEKTEVEVPQVDEKLLGEIKEQVRRRARRTATQVEDKLERQDATKKVEEEVFEAFGAEGDDADAASRRQAVQLAFDKLEKDTIRTRIAVDKKRPDGRKADEIRDISIEVGRRAAHARLGALHARPDAGVLGRGARHDARGDAARHARAARRASTTSTTTTSRRSRSGRPDSCAARSAATSATVRSQSARSCRWSRRSRTSRTRSASSPTSSSRTARRRWRRCAGRASSLMDAGVPIKRAVAGIAMGLIKEGDDYIVLSDIAGVEDHLGDMDFKVAGTSEGITALQMDIKITGVTFDILRDALEQAKEGRTFILGKMAEVIDAPREEMSEYAPRISSIQIDTDKIGMVIGKGGETIRALSEEFEAQIDVNDDGIIRVYAQTGALGDALVERIESMTKDVEVGDTFTGKVVKTTTFGAFVELVEGHRRPAAHLEHQARRAGGHRRGRARPRPGDRRARGRGRPRARPDRPAARRRPRGRGQDRRGARRRRHRRRRPAGRRAAAVARAAAATAAAATAARATATGRPRRRPGPRRDRRD